MALSCEVVHVAVGDDRTTSRSLVQWSIRNFPGKHLRITHILCPKIAIWGDMFLGRNKSKTENRRESALIFLDECVSLCASAGLPADKVYREEESVGKGLVNLVTELNIRWLVVGAAASQRYNSYSKAIASRKALHVFEFAPPSCKIWFVCNGILFYTRKAVRLSGSASDRQSVVPFSAIEDNGTEVSSDENKDDESFSIFREEPNANAFLLQLREVITDTMSCERELLEARTICSIAEANALGIARKATEFEAQFSEDLRGRRELEEAEIQKKQNRDKIRAERDSLIRDLQSARDQINRLETRNAELNDQTRLLQNNAKSTENIVNELNAYKIQNENLEEEAKKLRQNSTILTFSELELRESTEDFDESRVIGEGGYGVIYRGNLHNTEVAVKVPRENSKQGENEYSQEVKVLGTMRHPNIISLIGVCPEKLALVYEYLPNGSLEDKLTCKNNSPPLSWQSRIRIAVELCSALSFLQHNAKHCVVHGDLKPSNILLDAHMAVKLSDFGICRMLQHHGDSGRSKTILETGPKGSFAYIDPEFLRYGELSPKSDVYSFGIVVLRLLTGKPATRVLKEVKEAEQNGRLEGVLDRSAGRWPMEWVEKMVTLAMECCKEQESRPSVGDVWRCLEPMMANKTDAYGWEEPPAYFMCPLNGGIMEDPHVAADGYSYERVRLVEWFERGHDTSPCTTLKLPHFDIVPNFPLRFAIQDWLKKTGTFR